MRVLDLIEQLQLFPDDATVLVAPDEAQFSSETPLKTLANVRPWLGSPEDSPFAIICGAGNEIKGTLLQEGWVLPSLPHPTNPLTDLPLVRHPDADASADAERPPLERALRDEIEAWEDASQFSIRTDVLRGILDAHRSTDLARRIQHEVDHHDALGQGSIRVEIIQNILDVHNNIEDEQLGEAIRHREHFAVQAPGPPSHSGTELKIITPESRDAWREKEQQGDWFIRAKSGAYLERVVGVQTHWTPDPALAMAFSDSAAAYRFHHSALGLVQNDTEIVRLNQTSQAKADTTVIEQNPTWDDIKNRAMRNYRVSNHPQLQQAAADILKVAGLVAAAEATARQFPHEGQMVRAKLLELGINPDES